MFSPRVEPELASSRSRSGGAPLNCNRRPVLVTGILHNVQYWLDMLLLALPAHAWERRRQDEAQVTGGCGVLPMLAKDPWVLASSCSCGPFPQANIRCIRPPAAARCIIRGRPRTNREGRERSPVLRIGHAHVETSRTWDSIQ